MVLMLNRARLLTSKLQRAVKKMLQRFRLEDELPVAEHCKAAVSLHSRGQASAWSLTSVEAGWAAKANAHALHRQSLYVAACTWALQAHS